MKLRYFNLAVLLAVIAVVAMAGFRGHHFRKPPFEIFPDMNYQPKVKDQQASDFFANGVASREPVPGTVAEEMPAVIDYWASGKYDDSHWGDGIPVHAARDGAPALAVSDLDMARGRERYTINCSVCHGAAGDGKGITSQYGINATSYQSDRIRGMSDGEIFNTITHGKGQMLGYGYNIAIDDRWRIIMYIRALEHSENATLQDASPEEQQDLNKAKKPATTDDFKIKYLDRHTMVGWTDTLENGSFSVAISPDRFVPSIAHQVAQTEIMPGQAKRSVRLQQMGVRPSGIKYLNQKTVKGWDDDSGEPQPW